MRSFIAFIIAMILSTSFAFGAETWSFTALEYAPFSCEQCPDNGANAYAFKKAFEKEKIGLQFVWLPWSRAIMEARKKTYAGYFPAWPEDCQEGFTFSGPISRSALGIVERKTSPLKFQNLKDLKKYTLGVVQDYGNTLEFNKLVRSGEIKTEAVTTDALNVRKVALGRIDGALIDENILKHILSYESPELKPAVQFNKKILENKDLGMCFRGDVAPSLIAKLKLALKKQNSQKIVDEYLIKYFKKAGPDDNRVVGSEKKKN